MMPLVTLLVLGLLLVVTLALLVWAVVSATDGAARARRAAASAARRAERDARSTARASRVTGGDEPTPEVPRPPRRSNDELRGAKATRSEHQGTPDDAFERFLRAGREDDR